MPVYSTSKQAAHKMYVLNHKVKTNTREKIYTLIYKTMIKLLILYTLTQANPSTKTMLARNLYKRSGWKCICKDVCNLLFEATNFVSSNFIAT